MGIKDHLQGLTGIGYTKRFAAVAEAELGDLYFHRDASQLHLLVAPVELEGVAWGKLKRYVGFDR